MPSTARIDGVFILFKVKADGTVSAYSRTHSESYKVISSPSDTQTTTMESFIDALSWFQLGDEYVLKDTRECEKEEKVVAAAVEEEIPPETSPEPVASTSPSKPKVKRKFGTKVRCSN